MLEQYGISIQGYLSQLGPINIESVDFAEIDQNPFFCPDASKVQAMEEFMAALTKEGNSIGAVFVFWLQKYLPAWGSLSSIGWTPILPKP
ncbi:MAG: hypothetical protein CM1200mP40_30660 [Gammaproteobacteria bacterium]|nr:MAG: hypothetical protein CM1200mP40_30660 [Gammaproteobacteria bacterium]